LDDLLDCTVCASDTHEGAKEDQKDVESVLGLLPQISLVMVGMVVQPQPARQCDSQRSKANRSRQRNQVVEDGNSLGENKSDGCKYSNRAEPCSPVNNSIGLQMIRIAKNANEAVLGRNVEVETR